MYLAYEQGQWCIKDWNTKEVIEWCGTDKREAERVMDYCLYEMLTGR